MRDSLIVNVAYVMLLEDAVGITALYASPRGFRRREAASHICSQERRSIV